REARTAALEADLFGRRGAQPHALPSPESDRAIDPPTSAITPPSEQSDSARNLYRGGPRGGHDNPRPPVTLDGKVEPAQPPGSWRGPTDGPPPSRRNRSRHEKRA